MGVRFFLETQGTMSWEGRKNNETETLSPRCLSPQVLEHIQAPLSSAPSSSQQPLCWWGLE